MAGIGIGNSDLVQKVRFPNLCVVKSGELGQRFVMRWLTLLLVLLWSPAPAEVFLFKAPSGPSSRELIIYSSLDERLASPLIAAFQA